GSGRGRRGARLDEPGNRRAHALLALRAGRDPDRPAVPLPIRHRRDDRCRMAAAARGAERVTTASPPMLEVRGVRKSFGGFTAVDGVSVSVAPQEIVAIIGPNGAGKSTFFNLITGHLRPDEGEVHFEGRPITHLPPHRICRLGM